MRTTYADLIFLLLRERDAVQKAEELQRIYGAVKRQNCKLLACSDIEKNQKRKKKLKDKS